MAHASDAVAELKSGHFQCMQLRVLRLDPAALQAFLAEQVAQAPRLLTGAPLVLDIATTTLPELDQLREVLERARFCGVLPVAVAAESDSELAQLAEAAGLPAVAPDRRKSRKSKLVDAQAGVESEAEVQVSNVPAAPAAAIAAPPTSAAPMYVQSPVRSGQQLYARGSDMVLTTMVSAGAEVIADGSIHVYGRLSGKALAGARGDRDTHIFCLAFDAELVAIAGHFRVFETVPPDLKGRPCHLWLNGDKLEIQPLGA